MATDIQTSETAKQAGPTTTTEPSIPQLVDRLRTTFDSRLTRPYEWRVEQLNRLKAFIAEKQEAIFAALEADLGKCSFESALTETGAAVSEINFVLK